MPQQAITAAVGLYTSANPLRLPEGALARADNIVLRRPGVIEPRRGFSLENATWPQAARRLSSFVWYRGLRVANYQEPTAGQTGILAWADAALGSSWTTLADATARNPDVQRINMAAAGGRLWVADRARMQAYGDFGATVREWFGDKSVGLQPAPIGLPQVPDPQAVVVIGGTVNNFLAPNSSVAYRLVFAMNYGDRAILGPPSGRTIVSSFSQQAYVQLVVEFPLFAPGSTPTSVLVYRTPQVPSSIQPGDEMFLVREQPITAADLAAGRVFIDDGQPEELLGEPLYTNPSTGGGIEAANFEPPNCIDVALWDDRLWFGNTRSPTEAQIRLLGISSLVNGNTVVVNGVTFTAVTGSPITAGEFQIATSSSNPSVNTQRTAQNLILKINLHPSTPALATYLSGANDAPGLIGLTWLTTDGTVGPPVTFSNAAPWQVVQQSTVTHRPHGLAYSKPDQPEAVPLLNFLTVNTEAHPIVRIFPMRDRLLVFKTDGLYVVSGQAPYRVDALDDTCILFAPDSLAYVGGRVYALTNHGIVAIVDSGLRPVSQPIDEELRTFGLTGEGDLGQVPPVEKPQWRRNTFAVAHENERSYTIYLGGTDGYRYDDGTGAWTKVYGPLSPLPGNAQELPQTIVTYGQVEPSTDRQWLATGVGADPLKSWWAQKRTFTRWDFADEVGRATGFTAGATQFELIYTGISRFAPEIGDVLAISGNASLSTPNTDILIVARIAGVSGAVAPVSLLLEEPLVARILTVLAAGSTASLHRGIKTRTLYSPLTLGAPGLLKRFREGTLHFVDYSVRTARLVATVDMEPGQEHFEAIRETDAFVTGDPDVPALAVIARENKRRLIPKDTQVGGQMLLGYEEEDPFCSWQLLGFSLMVEPVSERLAR